MSTFSDETSSAVIALAAFAAIVAIGFGFATFTRRKRRLGFKRAHDHLQHAPLPTSRALESILRQAKAPDWFAACQAILNTEDLKARSLQQQYHSGVVQSIAVLSCGVLITCVGAVVLRDMMWLERFAASYDLIGTIYASVCFLFARIKNREFVKQRSCAEVLRAWLHLAIIFPLERSRKVEEACHDEKARIRSWIYRGTHSALLHPFDGWPSGSSDRADALRPRVETLWTEMQATCRSAGQRRDLSAPDIGFYFRERPCEQLDFFTRAQHRIHYGHSERELLMFGLYVASLVLAILKALSVFKAGLPTLAGAFASQLPLEWISTGLIGVMVFSAAVTNAFLSRNERSLLHSYHAQERRIRHWFALVVAELDAGKSPQVALSADSVLAFEDLMFNELLDFIHITSFDVIEAPG